MGILVEHQKAITQLTGRIRELEAATRPPLTLTPPDAQPSEVSGQQSARRHLPLADS
jgi:hypothetical protein